MASPEKGTPESAVSSMEYFALDVKWTDRKVALKNLVMSLLASILPNYSLQTLVCNTVALTIPFYRTTINNTILLTIHIYQTRVCNTVALQYTSTKQESAILSYYSTHIPNYSLLLCYHRNPHLQKQEKRNA